MPNKNLTTLFNDFNKIEIPIIQRDYAQGRKIGKAPKVRDEFLESLYDFLVGSDSYFHLDFIYGIEKDNKFIPLDGQQRLTTLFLLYWYHGKKENIDNLDFLTKFTYETRISSRDFCNFLIKLDYSPSKKISPFDYISNQNKYVASWRNDPTISSMLVMLDAIHSKFKDTNNIYTRLDLINFSFPDKELKFSEDIYIKMNSRGKELTAFENFKATFESLLDNFDETKSQEFSMKIDNDWCDLFWEYREDNDISNPFLRFFLFITEMLYFEFFVTEETENCFNKINVEKLQNDGEVILGFYQLINKIYFSHQKGKNENFTLIEKSKKALEILFDALNDLSELKRSGVEDFFNGLFYTEDSVDENSFKVKINIFRSGSSDFLQRIISSKSDNTQSFKLLFYSVLKTHLNIEFRNAFRIIRNLVSNDEDNMRAKQFSLQIHFINTVLEIKGVKSKEKTGFRQYHIDEEEFKEIVIKNNSNYSHLFWEMENNVYFYGSIRAVFNVFSNNITDAFIRPENLLKKDFSNELRLVFESMKELLNNDMTHLWGELLIDTEMYKIKGDRINRQYKSKRHNSDYEVSSYLQLLVDFHMSNYETAQEFLLERCRNFIKENIPLNKITSPQKQLYIMYLIHIYILKKKYDSFFLGNWQFGIYGENYNDFRDDAIIKHLEKSPFPDKTAIQLFHSQWAGGQPMLKQPTKEELEKLESL